MTPRNVDGAIPLQMGYLVPEFPGQTHAFFWREIRELRKLGVRLHLVSTRLPRGGSAPHHWAPEAVSETMYLFPMGLKGLAAAAGRLVAAGPVAVGRCVGLALRSGGGGMGGVLRSLGLVLVAARLAAASRSRRWMHIHVHSCADAAGTAMLSEALGGPPYSLTLHGDLTHYGSGQAQKWRRARFGIVVAEHLREQLLSVIPGLQPDKVSVCPMGVDVEVFKRSTPYQPPRPEGTLRLIACGRLVWGKGHQDIVRAVAILREHLKVSLTILGSGDQDEALRTLASQLGIADAVDLAGSVSETNVKELLEASHIYISASHDEAVGVATMEAMAMELPVLATKVGGVAGLVRDGQEGLLVPPQQPDAICKAVAWLIEQPIAAEQMGKAGKARVHKHFHSRLSATEVAHQLSLAVANAPTARSCPG